MKSVLRLLGFALMGFVAAGTAHAVNTAPVAIAGGPYTMTVGGTIKLNGASSNDPDLGDSLVSYSWDINNDGVFGDLTGAQPVLSGAAFSLVAGSYTISLRVTDVAGATGTATAALTVVSIPHLTVYQPFAGNVGSAENPQAPLVLASDGRIYGTSTSGGAFGNGTIFRIEADGTGFVVLHSLKSETDGKTPQSGLVQASDGKLYGTTFQGGINGYGTIFSITTDGTYTVLRSLTDSDGRDSYARLVQASDGKLYGTARTGGSNGAGTIFSITTGGTYTVLRSLSNAADGGSPYAGLVQASDGKLYGTTNSGGSNNNGTIFSITTGGTYTVLRSLSSAADGRSPYAALVQASDGKLYGTMLIGGSNNNGTIFSITTGGTYTVLRSLSSAADGAYPYAALVQASDGKLYGTTSSGGSNGAGTIFSITTDGTYSVLRSLTSSPLAGLVQASDGKLYGTTYQGGSNGYGTIFSITTDGTYSVLRSLGRAADGANPYAGLVQASDGKLYGTTFNGGSNDNGTIFSITTGGTYTVLRSLSSAADGGGPYAGLVQASDGKLYGTTYQGGSNGYGTIFSITTDGTYSVLRSLTNSDGRSPQAGLVQASDGKLYGTTYQGGSNGYGTIFSITTDGTYSVLRSLSSAADGANPIGGLVQASDGKLCGTTRSGGSIGYGTIFSITTGGTYTALRSLSNAADGGVPYAGLVQASDGKLYGTTVVSGSGGKGTIFSYSLSNQAPLAAFTATPNPATVGASVSFNGSTSSDADGDILTTYAWDFGDSSTPVSGASSFTTHTYTAAGTYAVTLVVTDVPGATSTATTLNVVVNKLSQTLTFGSLAGKTYGNSSFTVSASASSGLTPTYSYVSGPATVSGNTVTITGAGTVTVRASQAGNATYNAAVDVDQSFVVAKASQTITFGALAGKTYGAPPFTLSATANSGLTPTYSYVSGPASVSGNTVTITGVGTVVVRASQAGDTNYNAASDFDRSFTVGKATATVTLGSLNPTYDAGAKSATVTTNPASLTVGFTYNGSATAPTAAGSYTVVGTISDTNYQGSASGTLVIGKASQTITFGALSDKTYGDAAFAVSATASSGLTPTYSYVSGPASVSGNTVTITGAGTVVVRASQAGDSNYNAATLVDQSFTVAKKTLTVTADAKTRAYGAANPAFTATLTGFVNGDIGAVVTGTAALSTTVTATSTVGDYAITAALGGLSATNYDFSFTAGTLAITKAPLTVTADAKTRIYGDANPTLTATITGYVNSETSAVVSGTPTLSTGATPTSSVGGYTITVGLGGLTATNYSFSLASGTLTVGKAQLTVTADAKTKVYGAANPTLTASYSGFKNSENATVLTGAPALATTATSASGVADYPITAALGTLVAGNYSFGFVDGALAVTKAPLTVTADNKNRAYGVADPAFTATLTGFVNGDVAVAVVSGAETFTTTATGTSAAGTYPITPALGTLSAANYAFTTFTPGTLTVGQTSQTITFGTLAGKIFGDAAFTVNATASSGLVPSYSIQSGPATISGSTVTLTGAGTVVVRASQAGDANYSAATPVDQSFTVAKATGTVTLGSLDATYDGSAKSATATTNPGSLTVGFTYDGNATAPNAAGSYAVVGTISAANYQGSVSGTLVIAKADQTITFGALPDTTTVGGPIVLSANASSGLPVALALVSGPASLNGATLTLAGSAGTVTVRATQTGNPNYIAALPIDRSFDVIRAISAPVILQSPASRILNIGQSTTLSVVASGEGTLTYQWFKNGIALTDATTPTFTIVSAAASDGGSYVAVVSNGGGAISSNAAVVAIEERLYGVVVAPGGVQFGLIDGTTGSFSYIADMPAGLGWPLGDQASQPDPVNGMIFSTQGGRVMSINKKSGATTFYTPPNFGFIVGYDNQKNELIYYSNAGSKNNLYSYNVATGVSALLASGWASSVTMWQAGGLGAVSSVAREAFIYDSQNNTVFVLGIDSGLLKRSFSPTIRVLQLVLDEPNQRLVGISNSSGTLRLVEIDAANGVARTLGDSLGSAAANYVQAISAKTGRYYFQGGISPSEITVVSSRSGSVINSFPAPLRLFALPTLTVGGGSDSIFSNNIDDPDTKVVKIGSGMVTLSGINRYENGTEVLGGAVVVSDARNLGSGDITLDGGALKFSSPVTTANGITVGLNNGFIDTNGQAIVLSGAVVGTGNLVKQGAGSATLAGPNLYSGSTTINSGSLIVANTTGSGTGFGSVTVNNGATIGGTGSVSGEIVFESGGTVSPGSSPGTLNSGSATLRGGANFVFEINNPNGAIGTNWDCLNVRGSLSILASPSTPVVLKLTSLDSNNSASPLSNFDPNSAYSWQFIATTAGVGSFSPDSFQCDVSQFRNNLAGGRFSVSQVGNNLFLNFTPVAAQTITFGAISGKTYGDAAFSVSATVSSGLAPSYNIVSGPATISGSTITITGAGTVVVRASQSGNADYNAAASVDQSFPVAKSALTVSADSKTQLYGAANPSFTTTITGFVNGDTVSVVTGSAAFTTTANPASAVGSYPITPSLGTLATANYAFTTFTAGTLTVGQASQTISFAALEGKTYGDPSFAVTATSSSGLAPTFSIVSGPATISGGTITLNGAGTVVVRAIRAGNTNTTTATPVDQSFTVAKKTLTVTADAKTRIYGDANPALTATLSGFVNGETSAVVSGLAALSTSATATSGVGDYVVNATSGSLNAANYSFAFVNGTLTVAKALLTVAADNQSRIYGAANLAFTASYSGFKNGETSAVLAGAPVLTTVATTGSGVADYPIMATIGTLGSGNYIFAFSEGVLAVTKAPLTVTADNATRAYGVAEPEFTATLTGFVNGDAAVAVVSGAATFTTTATLTSAAGTYPIAPALGTLSATNYVFTTFRPGILTVGQSSQTLNFAALAGKTYGDAAFILSATASSGLVPSFSIVSGPATLTNNTITLTGAGTVVVRATQAGDTSYSAAASVDQSFTVTPAVLTATASNQTRLYGAANPALTVSTTGFVNGDTAAALITAPGATTTATAVSNVGTYPITVTGGVATNYTFSAVTGTLTVTPGVATVTLGDLAATYDGANKSATATTTPGGLAVSLTYNGGTTAPTDAGSYAVVAMINNTNVTGSASGTLVIGKAAQSVSFGALPGTVNVGAPVALSASASSGLAIGFSVVNGNASLTGATLTLNDTAPVVIRATQSGDANRSAASVEVTLTAGLQNQTITFAALGAATTASGPITLSATASSGLSVAFSLVSGPATLSGSTLTLTSVAGTVIVRATQPGSAAFAAAPAVERAFTVTNATAAPIIVQAPNSRTLNVGQSTTLTVVAIGEGTLSYQWLKDGAQVSGANATTLALSNVSTASAGAYRVDVTNAGGTTRSSAAEITVTDTATAPVITTQPSPQTAQAGGTATFTVVATGNPAPTYQWQKNGAPISGATAATFTLLNVQAGDAASYDVVVSNVAGTVNSSFVPLTVNVATTAPIITRQPGNDAALVGETVVLSVAATGAPAPTYQWQKDGVVLSGGTAATLTLPSVTKAQAGGYAVVVSNAVGSVTSRTAALTVLSHSYAGTYFGTLSGGGTFALYIREDNTGVFLGFTAGATTAYVSRDLSVDDEGRFTFTSTVTTTTAAAVITGARVTGIAGEPAILAASELVFTGTISRDGNLSGTAGTLTLGATKSVEGATQAVAGFYAASASGSSAQTLSIVSPSGQALVVVQTAAGVDAGAGSVNAAGTLAVTTAAGQTIAATVSATTSAVNGTVTDNKGVATTFTGTADGAAVAAEQRLGNLSSRARVGLGEQVSIAGFVISGEESKSVLIRAVGPALTGFGVQGALAAPKLDLYRGGSVIATNTGWTRAANAAEIGAAATRAGAFSLAGDSADSAVLVTLAPGAYSAIVSSANGAGGVALVEVYDLSGAAPGQKLINLSTRAFAGLASDTLIAGVVVNGTAPKRVLIRAAGPALAAFGISGALGRPKLELFSGSTVIAQNTGWSTSADAVGIAQAGAQVGAFAFTVGAGDSALLVNLAPGAYTAQVSGMAGTTGVALIEIYEVP